MRKRYERLKRGFLRHGLDLVHLEFFGGSQKELICSDLSQIPQAFGRAKPCLQGERAAQQSTIRDGIQERFFMYKRWMKRAFDIGVASAVLVVCAPLMLVLSILIRVMMGTPILFRQVRPGFKGQAFTCLKFRTMTDKRDGTGALLPDRERMVPLGAWLRRTSLDELPQLWNIVRGDLSLIGPRPLLTEYMPYYTAEEQRRHSIRPGLTGWAQVHGRNILDFDERLKMDVWYVDHVSWQLDLRILLATVRLVFSAKGTELVSYLPLHEQRRMKVPFHGVEGPTALQPERGVQQ